MVHLLKQRNLVNISSWLPHQFDKRGRIYHTSDFGHHNTDGCVVCFVLEQNPIGDQISAVP